MKFSFTPRWLLALGCLLLGFINSAIAVGNAPDSVAGKSFIVIAQAGSSPWASIGAARVTLSATSNIYKLEAMNPTVYPGAGTYSYSKTGDNSGTVSLTDVSVGLPIKYNLVFTSPTTATYSLTALGGSQIATVIWENVTTQQVIGDTLANMSVRAVVPKDGKIVPGFVLATATKVLIRVGGPALAGFGVPGTLANPKLTVYSGTTSIASNDDWCSTSDNKTKVLAAANSTGAFAFVDNSKDSAIVLDLAAGPYTAEIGGEAGTTGEVILEVYRVQ